LLHFVVRPDDELRYRGQVGMFAVYCRQTSGVYLIPTDVLPLDRAYLRITAPANGQRRRIRFASDYELARITCTPAHRSELGRDVR
jgi:hypothetical protein